jgi:DNA mismatch endonuclease, patch repair protein
MDRVTPAQRSENMRRIRSADTEPEMIVRRHMHAAGLRFRVHRRDLPGCPDLVFPSRRVCLFVHGCFWHGCPHCRTGRRAVQSRPEYWAPKIVRNRLRDKANRLRLEGEGWHVLELWACELKDGGILARAVETVRKFRCHKGKIPRGNASEHV